MSPDPWNKRQPENDNQGGSRLGLYVWIGLMLAGALGLWQLNRLFPGERSDTDTAYLIQGIALLALFSSGIIFVRRFNFSEIARNIALWLGVCAVIALGYVYQDEMRDMGTRLMSEIVPGYAVTSASGEMVLTETQGHFFAIGDVKGVPVVFLIDTGASDIVLSPADAKRIGIDMDALNYSRQASTANGMVRGAPTTLSGLTLNGIEFPALPVTVNGAEMETSLLGMAFLKRLKSYEVRGRQLYLRW